MKENAASENNSFAKILQILQGNKELLFHTFDLFPLPVEIFAPDGTAVFLNRIFMEVNKIPDTGLVVGNYNVLNDPVCNDQMGLRDDIQKAFHGEAVVVYDVAAPIQDLVDRGIIAEKPFEKSLMDWYLYPVKDKGTLVFVVFVCVVKKRYHGRPDLTNAREYMESHWQGDYNAKTVAKSANMSVAQLYKLFKWHTGMTPGNYHKKIKIEHIKENLADKNLSIKQAFAACGEDSRGWIAKVFKKTTGLSPSEFRETYTLNWNKHRNL